MTIYVWIQYNIDFDSQQKCYKEVVVYFLVQKLDGI